MPHLLAWPTVTVRRCRREALHPGLVVSDLIYHPSRTPLMEAAEAVGARVHNGLGMLVGQAAAAFSIWTGLPAPIGAMTSRRWWRTSPRN